MRVPKIVCESSGRSGLTPPGITSSNPLQGPTAPRPGLTVLISVQTVKQKQQALFPLLQILSKLFQVQPTIWVRATLWGEALARGKGQRELQEAAPPSGGGTTSLCLRNPGPPTHIRQGQGQGQLSLPSISWLLSKMSKTTVGL